MDELDTTHAQVSTELAYPDAEQSRWRVIEGQCGVSARASCKGAGRHLEWPNSHSLLDYMLLMLLLTSRRPGTARGAAPKFERD